MTEKGFGRSPTAGPDLIGASEGRISRGTAVITNRATRQSDLCMLFITVLLGVPVLRKRLPLSQRVWEVEASTNGPTPIHKRRYRRLSSNDELAPCIVLPRRADPCDRRLL